MIEIKLSAPVFTLDGKNLLPAGATVNIDTIDKLVASNPNQYDNIPLFQHSTVASDIRESMFHQPYDIIFADKNHAEHLLGLLEKVKVIKPVLDSLDYFKTNDYHTYRHILMVYVLSCFFGEFLIPDFDRHLQDIAGGPTHDFGKINVPLAILSKKEALTRKEYKLMQHHSIAGYCLLCYYHKDAEHNSAILARDHHERCNGKGYPSGIIEIDPMVELVIVSDVYDALLSPRSYRSATFDNRSAVEVITAMAEKGEIGWEIVKLLTSQNRTNKPNYKTLEISSEKRGHSPAGNRYGIVIDDE